MLCLFLPDDKKELNNFCTAEGVVSFELVVMSTISVTFMSEANSNLCSGK